MKHNWQKMQYLIGKKPNGGKMEALAKCTKNTHLVIKGKSGPEPALSAGERASSWLARVNEAFGVEDTAVGQYLINSLTHVFSDDPNVDLIVDGIVGLIKEQQPQDGLERMALVQISLVHHASLRQSKSSFAASPYTRDDATSLMCKLMRLYMQQMAAFRKYRNKASQSITVNYVQSANTVVGDVHTR